MSTELSTSALLTGCEVYKGKNAAEKNSKAIIQIYDAIKTSYGPLGLDKMCVDASGTVHITNDGATILKNMLVDDPSAKLLVNLSLEQDKEVGDGTTSVVLIASNLIIKGCKLIQEGVHPSIVVSGYRLAFNECVKYIKNGLSKTVSIPSYLEKDAPSPNILDAVISTTISSKLINQEKDLFVNIVKDSLRNIAESNKYPVEKINVLKSIGGSLKESEFINGYILNCTVASKHMPKMIANPKILCIGLSLNKEKLPLSASIQVNDPAKLEEIRREEIELTKRKCQAIVDSGANVILSSQGFDELCIKMFVDNGIVAVRRCDIDDLKTLASALNTEVKESLINIENEYKIEGLGQCESFEIKEIGDYDLVFLTGCRQNISTILLRGPNEQILDEAERSLNDALQISKRALETRSLVPGGGSVEAALSFLLEDFSCKINCKEHVAIHRYSESLLEIPKILANNAGLDSSLLISDLLKKQLYLFESGVSNKFLGLNVLTGDIQDNFENGIVEPTIYKLKALKIATEAAISILRINEVVKFPESK